MLLQKLFRHPDDPARAVAVASWLIRIAIVAHLCGILWIIASRGGTSVGNVLFNEFGFDDQRVAAGEKLVIALVLGVAGSLLVHPTVIAALFVAGAIFLETSAQYRFGGAPFSSWVYWTSSLRYLLPLAFAALIALPKDERWGRVRYHACAWIMRVGIALVFISHGLEALYQHPQFIDLIIGSANRWVGFRPTEWQAVQILKVIGTVDVVVGVLLMFGRWRWLIMELALWGLITALSRVTASGAWSTYEVLLRTSHFLAPIALWYLSPVLAQRGAGLCLPAAALRASPQPA
ncbi:DoxX family membrane protein [Candidatus Sumerlaeota bacterium]|nr:DoxX family membrane protein [Candidatus Sumerlaeota bacterium]